MQLTEHFALAEFTATSTGLPNIPSDIEIERIKRLAKVMEEVREVLGHPILISSGFRSELVNRAVGGSDNSAHLLGLAADITSPGFGSPLNVCMAIIESGMRFDQIINEYKRRENGSISNWVHFGLGAKNRQHVMTKPVDSNRYVPGIRDGSA